jgi:transposase-like protein
MPTKRAVKPSASRSNNGTKTRPSVHKTNIASKATFLAELKAGNTVSKAAQACGVHRRTLYDWRDQDPEFRAAWEEAITASVEILEDEVRTRALDRTDKFSHLLLMFLLKKHRPEYRENYKREVTVKHETVHEIEFSREEMDEAINILTRQKKQADAKES